MMGGLLTMTLIALGGGIGAVLRYAMDYWITGLLTARRRSRGLGDARGFPWGIVAVNFSGSWVLGLLVGLGVPSAGLWPAVTIGVLGGYTTFSTASLDTARYVLEGKLGKAAVHAIGTLGGAIVLAAVGIVLGVALATRFGGL